LLVIRTRVLVLQLGDGIAPAAAEFELIVDLQHPLDALQPVRREIGLRPLRAALQVVPRAAGSDRG
jgi:hypothetical protein